MFGVVASFLADDAGRFVAEVEAVELLRMNEPRPCSARHYILCIAAKLTP